MKPLAILSLLPVAACAAPAPQASPAELAAGERLLNRCLACHATEAGRNTPAGPTLHAVVNRRVAAEPGYNYSPALRRLAAQQARWTPELLDRFLADPAALAPGTEMGFMGLDDPQERRALIAWLAQ